LQRIEGLLPARPAFEKPQGEHVEEADLNDYEPDQNSATQDSDDDDDSRGGPRVGCAQQWELYSPRSRFCKKLVTLTNLTSDLHQLKKHATRFYLPV